MTPDGSEQPPRDPDTSPEHPGPARGLNRPSDPVAPTPRAAGMFAVNPDLLFLDEIRHRPVWFTRIFLVFNLLVFVVMESVGSTSDVDTVVAFGAKSNAEINAGEIWRLLTPVFIHIGPIHLAFNCYALWIVGQQVERLYGAARFVVFYVVMGVAGVLGSYFYNPTAASAGASGAIFGLFGVLLMFGIRNRKSVPRWLARAIGRGVLPVIVLNLVIGLAIPVVDNSAHVAGLLSGMVLGGVFSFHAPGRRTPPAFQTAQTVSLVLIALSFLIVVIRNLPRI